MLWIIFALSLFAFIMYLVFEKPSWPREFMVRIHEAIEEEQRRGRKYKGNFRDIEDNIALLNSETPIFFKKKPITETEQLLYKRLTDALTDKYIFCQVQISQIVGVKKGRGWQSWFNKISRKSADFVICNKDFSIAAVIELDDPSHDNEERQKADEDKDTALNGAGYKIIRWRAENIPSIDDIRFTFDNIHALSP